MIKAKNLIDRLVESPAPAAPMTRPSTRPGTAPTTRPAGPDRRPAAPSWVKPFKPHIKPGITPRPKA